jgi:hypothetical protein
VAPTLETCSACSFTLFKQWYSSLAFHLLNLPDDFHVKYESQLRILSDTYNFPSTLCMDRNLWLAMDYAMDISSSGVLRATTGIPSISGGPWHDYLHIADLDHILWNPELPLIKYAHHHYTVMAPVSNPSLARMVSLITQSLIRPTPPTALNCIVSRTGPYTIFLHLNNLPVTMLQAREYQTTRIHEIVANLQCLELWRDVLTYINIGCCSLHDLVQSFLLTPSLLSPIHEDAEILQNALSIIPEHPLPIAILPWSPSREYTGLTSPQNTLYSFTKLEFLCDTSGVHILVLPDLLPSRIDTKLISYAISMLVDAGLTNPHTFSTLALLADIRAHPILADKVSRDVHVPSAIIIKAPSFESVLSATVDREVHDYSSRAKT